MDTVRGFPPHYGADDEATPVDLLVWCAGCGTLSLVLTWVDPTAPDDEGLMLCETCAQRGARHGNIR